MPGQEMGLIIFGAIIGFGISMASEKIRRKWDEHDQHKRAKQLFSAIIDEIEEGYRRCEGFVELRKQNKISFSRIYTKLWDSMISEVSPYLDHETIKLLHMVYYRFDLINFNMERGKFGIGAAFAESHLDEINSNLNKLRDKLKSWNGKP